MRKKEELYSKNPTYSHPLPPNFASNASDVAKGLFGLRLSLEEEKGSTELVQFMRCQIPLQGDNIRHPTSICMGERKPEHFGEIVVTVSFVSYPREMSCNYVGWSAVWTKPLRRSLQMGPLKYHFWRPRYPISAIRALVNAVPCL